MYVYSKGWPSELDTALRNMLNAGMAASQTLGADDVVWSGR